MLMRWQDGHSAGLRRNVPEALALYCRLGGQENTPIKSGFLLGLEGQLLRAYSWSRRQDGFEIIPDGGHGYPCQDGCRIWYMASDIRSPLIPAGLV